MRQRNSRFGHADKFDRLLRRDRELQRFWIGEADVFAGKNHNAPRDEPEIFTGMQHFHEPVHRALIVRSAHAFNKRTDRVVMRVARTIVDDRFLLNAFFSYLEREMNHRFTVAGGADPGSPGTFSTLRTATLR